MKGLVCVVVMALGAGLIGCADLENYDEMQGNAVLAEEGLGFEAQNVTFTVMQDFSNVELAIVGGDVNGDIGLETGIHHRADIREWHGSSYGNNVYELVVETDTGAAMAILNVYGGLSELVSAALQGQAGPAIEVQGCAGPEVDNWDYDEPADEVTVTVIADHKDPDVMHVHFTAYFAPSYGYSGSTATASLELYLSEIE